MQVMSPQPVSGNLLKGHLDVLVLAVVHGGAAHGYAIIDKLRDGSDGLLDLPEGTIYPLLHRLESRGLLSSKWLNDGRRRRVYALTRAGRHFLGEQRDSWTVFARAVTNILT
jgi:DNA-binding PadR family transcriptional regulator